MVRRKVSAYIPLGMLGLAAGILVRNFTHSNSSNFISGFLVGVSIVLMIFGFVKQR